MVYIFLDESGDLGFNFKKKNTSKFFIVTFLFFSGDKKVLEKLINKTHSELKKKIKRRVGTLHAVKEKPITRKRLLERLSKINCSIMSICLNKKKVYTKLRSEKQVLYNYVTNILLDRVYSKKATYCKESINLIASRRETNKSFNENFKSYLDGQVRSNHQCKINILIKTPAEEKALQVVDFASWSIFRKYEKKDCEYYNIINKSIIEESFLFPDTP